MNKIVMIIGLVLALGGLVFALLPHELHNEILGGMTGEHDMGDMAGMDHGSHELHQTIGLVVMVVGLGLAFAGWKIF